MYILSGDVCVVIHEYISYFFQHQSFKMSRLKSLNLTEILRIQLRKI